MEQDIAIGPSTGWLFAKIGNDLEDHCRVLDDANATAAEMVCHDQARMDAMLSGAILSDNLAYRALHLGSFDEFESFSGPQQQSHIQNLSDVYARHDLYTTVIHPEDMQPDAICMLQQEGVPFAVENVYRPQSVKNPIQQIVEIMRTYGIPAVLDLQHAAEIASNSRFDVPKVVRALSNAMFSVTHIQHLHLSGEVVKNAQKVAKHAQLQVATNRSQILDALHDLLVDMRDVPIILEGDPLPGIENLRDGEVLNQHERRQRIARATDNIAEEIAIVRKELRS